MLRDKVVMEPGPDFLESIGRVMARQPDKCAIRCRGVSISFGELDRRSACIAENIRSLGFPTDSLIGVMMDRSADLLVTLIGVLRSGNAFVPIDPRFPQERIDYMVSHSQAPLVITDAHLEGSASGAEQRSLASLESPVAESSVDHEFDPDSRAYVIYTSGSTGTPKGVVIQRSALTNFLMSMAERPGVTENDVLLAITTISFDIAYLELFLPLVVGATVVIASSEDAADGVLLQKMIDEHEPTVMQGTPATWQMLFAAGWSGRSGLKVLCGGEAAPTGLFTQLIETTAEAWNMYGPTETTIWSSCYRVQDEDAPVLIGAPIDETVLFVLDEEGSPVAPGEQGELHIGGAGLAAGYLHDPDMTDSRFVTRSDVWSEGKLYRTGDIVTFSNHETIAFVGRNDQQVKLRGYRIELGDVENAVEAHPGVETAAARVLTDGEDKRLVVFIATVASDVPSLSELRQTILDRLPEYMVPQRFLLVDEMPLTPNRKVDRRALDSMEGAQVISETSAAGPANETESAVRDIWCELLGIDDVGIDDDFFHVGGHSLIATRLWARLKTRFKVDIPLRAVFEESTVRKISARIAEISQTDDAELGIPIVSRLQAPAMSLTQQRFWYIDQLTIESPIFNLCAAFRFSGPLDTELMCGALREIVTRHEILRTKLLWDGDAPVQLIEPAMQYELEVDDLSALTADSRFDEMMTRINARVRRKVAIDRAPAFDACLYTLDDQDHVLFFMPHHMIWDGWSFDIFLKELKAFYEAAVTGSEAQLPELPIQYADYSVWHRERAESDKFSDQVDYWKQKLDGELPVLDVPTDLPRPSEFQFEGAPEYIRFDDEVVAGIARLARENSTTVNVVVLALYFGLLHRYTGQDDIIVGSPIQGRLAQETEDLIGVFVNALPIRPELSGDPSVVGLIQRVRDTALEAYQNQEVPIEKLVEMFGKSGDLSRPPIYQTIFTFQEVSERPDDVGDASLSQVNVHHGTCATEISFWVKSSPSELHGAIEYNTALFTQARIERMASHMKRFFAEAARDPEQSLSQVDYLSPDERQFLLAEFNDTDVERKAGSGLGELLAHGLEASPDETAIVFGDTAMSYTELHDRANRLAGTLRAEVGGDNAIVGICMTRSPDVIVALLACLKAGLAYLPMDPGMPDARNARMVATAKAALVLTEGRFEAHAAAWGAPVFVIDSAEAKARIESADDAPPTTAVDEAAYAYVTFTSGSTGLPKGVAVPRSAVANFLKSMMAEPGISSGDTVLGLTTITFDIHVLEIWGTLAAGGTLVLLSDDETADGRAIASSIEKHGVTLVQATPSTWHLLQASGWPGSSALKALVGGEAVSQELADSLTAKVGELWNMYGPTETTVWSTCCRLEAGAEPTIGQPIDNTEVFVLDANRQPVGVGVHGELFIAGSGLAAGYINDPERTNERFVQLDIDGGKRAYRTGDVVAVTDSGSLRFIDRVDNQVKVRGFRIELGEIENALLGIDGIAHAAARVFASTAEDARIIGYFTTNSNQRVATPRLRKQLREQLPYYMIPQHFIELQDMPVNSSGKLDRARLPEPAGSSGRGEKVEAPETQNEKTVAALWQELIGVEEVGRNDNFFEIGGHSLLSMKFISELRRRTGADLHVRDVVLSDLRQIAAKMPAAGGGGEEEPERPRSKYL